MVPKLTVVRVDRRLLSMLLYFQGSKGNKGIKLSSPPLHWNYSCQGLVISVLSDPVVPSFLKYCLHVARTILSSFSFPIQSFPVVKKVGAQGLESVGLGMR